jgi:hypothetical protein
MGSEMADGRRVPALASLRRFVRPPITRERCELCAAELPEPHAHLVEIANRRLCCACEACAILFSDQAAGRFRRVPRDVKALDDLNLTDTDWAGFDLPINLAFFLYCTPLGRVVAFYPSPAGATEALPPADAWEMLLDENPVLRDIEPDVEALLVNRMDESRDYFRVGVDECYRLVGIVRTHWQGLSGGPAVWAEIDAFFARLTARSGNPGRSDHA